MEIKYDEKQLIALACESIKAQINTVVYGLNSLDNSINPMRIIRNIILNLLGNFIADNSRPGKLDHNLQETMRDMQKWLDVYKSQNTNMQGKH